MSSRKIKKAPDPAQGVASGPRSRYRSVMIATLSMHCLANNPRSLRSQVDTKAGLNDVRLCEGEGHQRKVAARFPRQRWTWLFRLDIAVLLQSECSYARCSVQPIASSKPAVCNGQGGVCQWVRQASPSRSYVGKSQLACRRTAYGELFRRSYQTVTREPSPSSTLDG